MRDEYPNLSLARLADKVRKALSELRADGMVDVRYGRWLATASGLLEVRGDGSE